jgi:serine/threonine-protein kinase SRPK3
MGVRDESIFSEYVQDECDYPVPRKVLSDRIVYASRPVPLTTGVPVLCDLGEARFGDEEHREDIMPTVYRSPEVILGMEWSYKVDIWGLAMTVGGYPSIKNIP